MVASSFTQAGTQAPSMSNREAWIEEELIVVPVDGWPSDSTFHSWPIHVLQVGGVATRCYLVRKRHEVHEVPEFCVEEQPEEQPVEEQPVTANGAERWIEPEPLGYQLEGYTKLYGDPDAAANKNKGHKVVERKGQTWVIVPATSDPTAPCRTDTNLTEGLSISFSDSYPSSDEEEGLGTVVALPLEVETRRSDEEEVSDDGDDDESKVKEPNKRQVEEGSGEEKDEDGTGEFQKERDHIPDPKRPRAKDKGEDKPKVAKDVMEHLAAKAAELDKYLAAKAEDEDEDESKVKEPNKRQKLEVLSPEG